MSKRLEKIQKEIKAIEDSRKAFIAKFENGLKEVDAEIAQREENLENALAANDFEAYETESDKLAFLREKKQHLEIGLQNAETTGIGDYTKTRQEIFEAVTEAVEPKGNIYTCGSSKRYCKRNRSAAECCGISALVNQGMDRLPAKFTWLGLFFWPSALGACCE